MKRTMKKLSISCVVLASLVSANAANYAPDYSGQNWNVNPMQQFTYNPDADAAAWLANDYVAPYNAQVQSLNAPYFEYTGTGTAGAGDDVYFMNMTSNPLYINSDINVNSVTMGDAYWPINYAYSGFVTVSYMEQTSGTVQMNRLNIGSTFQPYVNNAARGGLSMAPYGHWYARSGSLNIGDLHMLSHDTTVKSQDNLGVSRFKIGAGTAANNNRQINIGNIHLSEQMLFLNINSGDWNITGDIRLEDGAAAGNMVVLLMGNILTYTEEPQYGRLTIHESELDQIIADGQLWTRNGNFSTDVAPVNIRTGANQINLLDPTSLGTWVPPNSNAIYRQITAETKDSWLRIVDLDGDAGDMVRVHIVPVPEPATMGLLALGSLLAFRRRR